MSFILVKVITTNGVKVLQNLDGTVRSLNPDGVPPTTYNWQSRPAGSAGAFEACTIDGGLVAYNPLGSEPVLFPFKLSVPNAADWSAIGVNPLV